MLKLLAKKLVARYQRKQLVKKQKENGKHIIELANEFYYSK